MFSLFCLFLMWMFLCLLPFPVSISLSLSVSHPYLSHFSVLDHQQRRRVKFSLPFFSSHIFCLRTLNARICFCTIHHVWSVFLLAVVQHGTTLLHTNLKFISQISDMGSEGFLLLAVKSQENIICAGNVDATWTNIIFLHVLYLKYHPHQFQGKWVKGFVGVCRKTAL